MRRELLRFRVGRNANDTWGLQRASGVVRQLRRPGVLTGRGMFPTGVRRAHRLQLRLQRGERGRNTTAVLWLRKRVPPPLPRYVCARVWIGGGGSRSRSGGGVLCIGGRRAGYSKRGTWVSASGAVLFSLTGVLLFMDRFTPQKMSTMTPPLTFATGVMGRWPPVVRAAARLSE